MKITRSLLVLAIPMSLAAQQPQAADPANPMTTVFRGRIANLHRLLPQAFDSVPADKFSYKPTPAQQTIGFVAAHLASDNYFFCSDFGEMKPTRPAEETSTPDSVKATTWPKEKLVTQLKESIAFCTQALAQVTDAKLAEQFTVTAGANTRQVTRVARLLGHAMDMQDHYSQMANYMRLNGILPPSALPRPAR